VSERSPDRRRDLLLAAIRVFARKGFHASRVGDIAEEAGVAHGLLYHYFRSKEEVLETIFRATWSNLVQEAERIEASGDPVRQQLHAFAGMYLGSWLDDPDLDRVLVREIARSPEVGRRVEESRGVFDAIARMVERGQRAGELRRDADPKLATWMFYGAMEEILTAWVLGALPDGPGDVARAVDTVVDMVCTGLAAEPAEARA
jgi:TetR/AcrR family transcriptional regulator, fatty acid metabolism regulator protein